MVPGSGTSVFAAIETRLTIRRLAKPVERQLPPPAWAAAPCPAPGKMHKGPTTCGVGNRARRVRALVEPTRARRRRL